MLVVVVVVVIGFFKCFYYENPYEVQEPRLTISPLQTTHGESGDEARLLRSRRYLTHSTTPATGVHALTGNCAGLAGGLPRST